MPMNRQLRGGLLVLAGATILSGCAAEVRSAVLGPDQGEIAAEQCSRPNPPRYESVWQPGPAEVQQLERDLPALDAQAPADCCGGLRLGDPQAYDRQYFGIVVQGRRLIYVNAFIPTMANKDFRSYSIVLCGGGSGAWGALYDPQNRSFSALALNGAR